MGRLPGAIFHTLANVSQGILDVAAALLHSLECLVNQLVIVRAVNMSAGVICPGSSCVSTARVVRLCGLRRVGSPKSRAICAVINTDTVALQDLARILNVAVLIAIF